MNGLANWGRLVNVLGVCFAIVFLGELWWSPPSFESLTHGRPPDLYALYSIFQSLSKSAAAALGVVSIIFWIFTKWAWKLSIFRKLDLINFSDLSGTWYATQYPAEWKPFTTVVSIKHSFHRLQVALIRNQSLGQTVTASLSRTETGARLYVIYYSSSNIERRLLEIPAVDRGENHSGALLLDLLDEDLPPSAWVMSGEYWTTKRRVEGDDSARGTWGRLEMFFKSRKLAPANVKLLTSDDKNWLIKNPTHP